MSPPWPQFPQVGHAGEPKLNKYSGIKQPKNLEKLFPQNYQKELTFKDKSKNASQHQEEKKNRTFSLPHHPQSSSHETATG